MDSRTDGRAPLPNGQKTSIIGRVSLRVLVQELDLQRQGPICLQEVRRRSVDGVLHGRQRVRLLLGDHVHHSIPTRCDGLHLRNVWELRGLWQASLQLVVRHG